MVGSELFLLFLGYQLILQVVVVVDHMVITPIKLVVLVVAAVVVQVVMAIQVAQLLELQVQQELVVVAVVADTITQELKGLVLQVVLVSSFLSIQKKFHLAIQQTLGSLDLLALGQHQQEHRMLTTRLLVVAEEEEEMLLVAVALVDSEQEQDYQSHQQHHIQ